MMVKNIFFSFTSSTCNPPIETPAITVSTWIITCCLHFSLTPQKYLCWLQKHMLPQTFLTNQTASKQAAGLSCMFILWTPRAVTSSPREHVCTAQPWGTRWCSLLWGGPMLWMAAVWKCIAEGQISLWTFLLGWRAPFELSHNCTDLVHTCSLPELWVGGASGASSLQILHSFILKTTEVDMGFTTDFFKLCTRPTFLHLKGLHWVFSELHWVFSGKCWVTILLLQGRESDLLSQLSAQALKADLIHCTHCVHFFLTNTEEN